MAMFGFAGENAKTEYETECKKPQLMAAFEVICPLDQDTIISFAQYLAHKQGISSKRFGEIASKDGMTNALVECLRRSNA